MFSFTRFVREFSDFLPISNWFGRPQPLGAKGEQLAAKFLRQSGYQLIGRGHRHKLGEIDLIMVDGQTIVFIEVKTRTSHMFGHPAEAVDDEKQRRISRSALGFLMRHELLEYAVRFDIVAITWPSDQTQPAIEHYKAAFDSTEMDSLF